VEAVREYENVVDKSSALDCLTIETRSMDQIEGNVTEIVVLYRQHGAALLVGQFILNVGVFCQGLPAFAPVSETVTRLMCERYVFK
jgi:hypothetical protein